MTAKTRPDASPDVDSVSERMAALADTFARSTRNGVCVVDGFGVKVRVERGALEVSDGIGEHRRVRGFDKATHGLSRLVVLNADGFVTFEALRWCQSLSIGVLVLNGKGLPTLASTPRMTDDARLRRAQAAAATTPVGLAISRSLIGAKVLGQARIAGSTFRDQSAATALKDLARAIEVADTVGELRELEAAAAATYFAIWSGREECIPRFSTKDRSRVPAHWHRFDTRRSVLASSNSNRKAERPTNALLNYVFALVESEATLAATAVGLDPGLGIVHLDAKARHSLVLDLMEPVRPLAESFVLSLLAERTFHKRDFTETRDGHVQLMAPLTHELAESLPRWRDAVGPWAEKVAHTLGQEISGHYVASTPLTSRRGKIAQAAVKARKTEALTRAKTAGAPRQRPQIEKATSFGCVDCGALVTSVHRVRCDACISQDARQTPAIRTSRAQAIASRKRALVEWEKAHPGTVEDPAYFAREILPRLAAIQLTAITEACSCSKGFASDVRRGRWRPHVSTWPALASLVGAPPPEKSEEVPS